jgi:hypothetical protein
MVLTPINVGAPSYAGRIEHVSRLNVVELLGKRFTVLQTNVCQKKFNVS